MNLFNKLNNNEIVLDISGEKVESLYFKDLFRASCYLIAHTQQCSAPIIQRKFKVRYTDAARIVEILENKKIVGEFDNKPLREVYIKSVEDMEVILDSLF
jgi:DNA segregation ATPase FtsK/SpoIIIE-like protein